MKKRIFYAIVLILLCAASFIAWKIFGPTVHAPAGKYFYIKTGSSFQEVKQALLDQDIISSEFFFDRLAKQAKYPNAIKAGRFEVRNGMSIYSLVRMLRSGKQSPVNFTITKLRTREDLASRIAANFETDSAAMRSLLDNEDSLRTFGLDRYTAMTAVIPNTYSIYWNSSPSKIFRKLNTEKDKFWTEVRIEKAEAMHLTPEQVYTLASIVEEETNKEEDKGKIASVYMNRISAGQRLEADPTIKFALKNFGLKRIHKSNIDACSASPFNTYYVKGLPPGPICTPSSKTIDAVLDAPKTNYLFFVARPDWSGLSNFTSSFQEHQVNARNYQRFLDSINIK